MQKTTEPKRNVFGIDAGLMLGVAWMFDVLQLGGKIGYLMATVVAGATSWIPFLNTIIAGSAESAAGALDLAVSIPVALTAYPTMWLWFALKHESPFSGYAIQQKIIVSLICWTVSATPIANALPDIVIWTAVNIYFSQQHYKEKLLRYQKQAEVVHEEIVARRQQYREQLLLKRAAQEVS